MNGQKGIASRLIILQSGLQSKISRTFTIQILSMDNPVDHIVDLGLVNYVKHPTNSNYIVYRFADTDRANSFRKVLEKEDIWFEESSKEGKKVVYTLFGIHKNDFKRTEVINFEVEAEHKKPFLPFAAFRYFLILFSALAIGLAILGYCKAQNKLTTSNEKLVSINRLK